MSSLSQIVWRAVPLLFGMLVPASSAISRPALPSSEQLFLWTASADSSGPDFLAVYDIRDDPKANRYGSLVATVPVPGRANRTHHIEHDLAADGQLFANGFGSGQTFIFDLTQPTSPRLAAQFGDVAGLMHPHSFWPLPNGNRLATFQMQHDAQGDAPGGLAELTPRGTVVRSSSANRAPSVRANRPYSAAIVSSRDRIVVTTSDMDKRDSTRHVQLWRLSDLSLQQQITLPVGPNFEGYNSAEPRLLGDGKTVLVSTFNCGLFLLGDLADRTPKATMVASFPRKPGTSCAVPVVAGHFYLVTVPAWSAVVSLDITDPSHPREVSRLTLGPDDVPHWIAIEPNHQRVVITGYREMKTRVLMARFNAETGALALDERFRAEGSSEVGMRMEQINWPHGGSGAGIPHGAVFGRAGRQ